VLSANSRIFLTIIPWVPHSSRPKLSPLQPVSVEMLLLPWSWPHFPNYHDLGSRELSVPYGRRHAPSVQNYAASAHRIWRLRARREGSSHPHRRPCRGTIRRWTRGFHPNGWWQNPPIRRVETNPDWVTATRRRL
jgi:hypothetical protein